MRNPLNLEKRLELRKGQNALRILKPKTELVDFSSNDYLGFSSSGFILKNTNLLLEKFKLNKNGSTGSRLLCGNHELFTVTEEFLAHFHAAPAALIFNSGYDANVGFFSSVPQRGDIIIYDELVHASIRDGIMMSRAKALKFPHNDLEKLNNKIKNIRDQNINALGEIYIVTESVFSMDGDIPPLKDLARLAEDNDCFLVIDEAHAVGVFGEKGKGLVNELELEDKMFARTVTFGKAMGTHGAAILGSEKLIEYLLNFSRSFIYTTALPPHSVAGILSAYQHLDNSGEALQAISNLNENISLFKKNVAKFDLGAVFVQSVTAIQCCIVPGNKEVKLLAAKLQENGYDVRPILSPTVPQGSERLRICLHSFNTPEEIKGLVKLMATFIK